MHGRRVRRSWLVVTCLAGQPSIMIRTRLSRVVAALLAVVLGNLNTPAQDAQGAAVQVTAVGVASPPAITFVWVSHPPPTGPAVAPRLPGGWGPEVPIPGGANAIGWTDTNVVVGTKYDGVVRIVWQDVAAVDTGLSLPGDGYLVGWSPAGPSIDAGGVDLTTDLPQDIGAANVAALHLRAAPAPVSTPLVGTLLTYTLDNVPESAPGSGVHLGGIFLAFGSIPGGLPLSFADMPGCQLYVTEVIGTIAAAGTTPSLPIEFDLPADLPQGLQFHAMAAALMQPYSLPNGRNGFGAVTSNGVASFVAPY
jgi:hypothetical protein